MNLTSKAALLLFSVALLFAGGVAPVHGQSALDGFDPNANDAIRVVVVQPDGKILVGGDFTTLAPNGGAAVTRNRIARLNPDGTLDTAFDPNASSAVYAIAVQADGEVLVGGNFSSIGGQTRNRIARLDAATGLADAFDPNATHDVYAIAVQADGQILVGGFFNGVNSIGGQTRNCIARLDATTGLADSFDPNANNYVRSIVVQADGEILLGGNFTNIGGQTRSRIARLDATTGLADSFDPNANGLVLSLAVQADGKILAGGVFTNIGGQTRNRIVRLDATTGLADSFNPTANSEVDAVVVQADGKILAGGVFTNIGGQTRNRMARLDAATGLADSFNPNTNSVVLSIAVQADGKILAGGFFNGASSVAGQTRNYIARLEPDGRLDQTLNLGVEGGGYVYTTAVQPDGKILIGGIFSRVLGVTRNYIARLNTDGTLDSAFNPNANADVYAIAVQADGKILVGGLFSGTNGIGGQNRSYIARLDAVTGLADSFNPNANGFVYAIAVQADGKILVCSDSSHIGGQVRNFIARLDGTTGLADSFDPNPNFPVWSVTVQPDGKILAAGLFSGADSIGGQTRNYIARLDATSGLADSFNPNANNEVGSIMVQPDGKILAIGNFTNIGGEARNRIVRLDSTTGLADSFDPNANNQVDSIALQADGKILVSGKFTSIGGQTRNGIARLDASTGLADSFDPNLNGAVYSIAVQADGKILAGGLFNAVGGQSRSLFARLSNDTAALRDLTLTKTAITWTHGGSSVQYARVTFEVSTDNASYAHLGNGLSVGSNWTLTGLNLPTGLNIYIRARGHDLSGAANNSESITESVRNAFLPGPVSTPIPTPTPTPPPTPTSTPTPTPSPTPIPTPTATPCPVYAERFDGVTAPALPAGWVATNASGDALWITSAAGPPVPVFDSSPNAVFVDDPATVSDKRLDSPVVAIAGASAQLSFTQNRNLENAFDGGVLEISINAGAFTDIVTAGGTFITGGYNASLAPTTVGNPLFVGGVPPPVWTGSTGGAYITSTVQLPGGTAGQNVQFRWRMGSDHSVSGQGWRIDSVVLNDCAGATASISGTVTYCSGNPVPGVTMTVTGTSGGSTLSDGSGNYTLTGLFSGGTYTVAPSKAPRTPGSAGINTIDVVATQRHFLNLGTPLSGCRLMSADVNTDSAVNTVDVIAVQRFFLSMTTGIAQVGRYKFTPPDRAYSAVGSNQTAQNYNTLILGDVASSFVHRLGGSTQ